MRERAEAIGATLLLSSDASRGTTIELSVPAEVAFEPDASYTPDWKSA
jgi:nitrate/nitrite-specific signal transduction histidine kinase